MTFKFFLGIHMVKAMQRTSVPLFVSRRVLESCKHPASRAPWALDSGGFTELSMHGRWITPAGIYASQARFWMDEMNGMQWAAVQDWMCEPFILDKTGLTVEEHQRRTIGSYIRLRELQPKIPWVPVLQGYKPSEYITHIEMYEDYGINLRSLPLVGIGSVCRRQSSDVDEAEAIIREVSSDGIRLHAFGFKTTGLVRCAHLLESADSMAWSYEARVTKTKLAQCTHNAVNCANCLAYALQWRETLLEKIKQPH